MSSKYILAQGPVIVRLNDEEMAHVPDEELVFSSWRDAKKALRSHYLNEATRLRSISEKDYFADR